MNLSLLIKKKVSDIFLKMGVYDYKLNSISNASVLILTYHRVLPALLVPARIEPGMYVTPNTLLANIMFIKRHFNIISINDAINYISGHFHFQSNKPSCVLTFDDGWLDFYKYAWPVLNQENVPAVVYLPTNLIGSSSMFWTDRLSLILDNRGFEVLSEILNIYDDENKLTRITNEQKRLYACIDLLKKLKYTQIDSLLDHCIKELNINAFSERSFMDWNEIRELYSSGLVTFGSHTVNHAILTTLAASEIYDELFLSRQKMIEEGVVGDRIPFCYPNGNYNEDIANMVKEIGYSSAVSCDAGWNTQENDPFALKRISFHQDISSTDSLFAYRLAGYL